jgi:two-component system, LuxR family, sensor kinase FixL
MNAAACLTLAWMHLVVWLKSREEWGHLLFTFSAVGAAAVGACELLLMRAETVAQYSTVLKWAHIPIWVTIVSLVWFAQVYLQAGRAWLAWAVVIMRTLALILNFTIPSGLNYTVITDLRHIQFLGEPVSIVDGSPQPWACVGQLSSLLLLIFLVDASRTLWRRGEQRRAIVLVGSMAFFITAAAVHTALLQAGVIHSPYLISFAFFGIILAMAYELSRDVIRASQLVRELKESEDRMSLAADAANLGIWVRDLKTNEIWASDNWRKLYGFTKAERVVFDHFLAKIHPDDRGPLNGNLKKALTGTGGYEMDYRVVLADGQIRWIGSRGRIEFNGGGKPTILRGVSVDITARKQAEMEVLQHRSELTHLTRVTMLGELSGSLAHELNQPLTAILSNAQAAQRFLAKDSADLNEVRDILQDIVNEDKRAGEVIHRLRLLLKKGEVLQLPLDVNEVVQEVLKLVRSDLVNHGVTAHTELALALPTANADRVQLQQVLLNLVLNACDSMVGNPDGHRRLVISTGQAEGKHVLVSVADNGTGITPENLEKVFDPFFTTKAQGMGLGLSVCRTIIVAHGGKLSATGNPDSGVTFRFTLPSCAEATL